MTSKYATPQDRSLTPRSADEHPWAHPYLTHANISRFREYSDAVCDYAQKFRAHGRGLLRLALSDNIAQNMHNWTRLAGQFGADAVLFVNPLDTTALSCPQWEEFDGEWSDLLDGEGFLRAHPDIRVPVTVRRVAMNDEGLPKAWGDLKRLRIWRFLKLWWQAPRVRYGELLAYQGFAPYLGWAREMSRFDVVIATNTPFAAFASGRPYCTFSIGGDLQLAVGDPGDNGALVHRSFYEARFIFITNPHTLAHSRRLGLRNGVYLPYPIDSVRYSPGHGSARADWESRLGPGMYVLSSARIDAKVKGQDERFFTALAGILRCRPNLRLVFLAWGQNADRLREFVDSAGLRRQVLLLSPVGKKRLIDYYRSCDVVLDQMVYGYLGATALEASSVGKPLIMKTREDQYGALYKGDAPPVCNVSVPDDLARALSEFADSPHVARERGEEARRWLVRNHGEERTMPLLLSLLRLAADRVPLPRELVSPLTDPETDEERAYHAARLAETRSR